MSSIDDFLELQWSDIENLPYSELQKIARVGISTANRRLTMLEKSGLYYGSVEYGIAMKDGKVTGRFKLDDTMNKFKLKHEIQRAQLFLRSKTSTLKGTQEFISEIENRVGMKLTPKQVQRMFKLYDEFKVRSPASTVAVGSTRMQQYFAEQIKKDEDVSIDDILDDAEENMRREYEEKELSQYSDIFEELGL